jgi:hyperosmotically inducible protein
MSKAMAGTNLKTLALIVCLGVLPLAGTGLTGCAGSRTEQSTGEQIDDMATSTRVRSALGDSAEYKFADVKVTTFKGTVQLSGFVNTREQRKRAGEIATNVEGAKTVVNNITVKD